MKLIAGGFSVLIVGAFACSSLHRQPASAPFARLPECIAEPTFEKGQVPEEVVAPLVAAVDEDEVVARLVFAEALASKCVALFPNEPNIVSTLTESIASVVYNRVLADQPTAFGKGPRGVVLHKHQFRSTLGGCDVATRTEFLCPFPDGKTSITKLDSSAESNRKILWEASVRAVEVSKTGHDTPLPGANHYFFTRHFDNSKELSCARWKGVSPVWTKGKKPVKDIAGCAQFYRL